MRKKLLIMLAGILSVQTVLTGCGSSVSKDANGVSYNNAYNEKTLVTTSGTSIKLSEHDKEHADDLTIYKTTGFGYVEPESWKDIANQDGMDRYSLDPEAFYLYYMPKEQVDIVNAIDENTSAEEKSALRKAAYASEFTAFCIYRVNEDDESTQKDAEKYKADFANVDTLATIGKDTFYFAYNAEIPETGLSEEDKKDIQIIINSYDTLKNNIMLFPPTDPMDDFKVDLSEFTTKDLDGNEVTADIFKNYDVTMINVWATWCKYCVQEMPEIEALYEELPDNVNIITLCSDAADEKETALEELNQAGATFTTIESNDELEEKVLNYVVGYPTTFFVDKNGKVIGQLQIGTPTDGGDNKEAYRALIDDALGNK